MVPHTRRVRVRPRSRGSRRALALALGSALVVAGCAQHESVSSTTRPTTPGRTFTITATRDALTTDATSPVIHDNEVMALAPHGERLFAATDQWEYPGRSPHGQVLVKNSRHAPWRVFEDTQSLRVQAIDSFPIPRDQGLGSGHSLLVTQAIVNGHSEVQWLLDGAASFTPPDSFVLASTQTDVRSFGAHEDGDTWSVYAGAEPTGILRGTWWPMTHTLVFDPTPELTAAPPGSPGLKTQKVTGFADCGGALYVTINTRLYRRNDGDLPTGVPRWVPVYQEPPVGPFNSGLRGVSCVRHDGAPALIVSTEGTGNVYRFDHLPNGRLDAPPTPALTPTLELSAVGAIRSMLAAQGTNVPATGKGAVAYVIAAYNDFQTVRLGGTDRQVFGFEWAYAGGCPSTRACGPTAFGGATFDAAACFAVRTDHGGAVSYTPRCLGGPDFAPTGVTTPPIRAGQAYVSIRTIAPSPFRDARLYYGGYDCNFFPADGTGWIASSSVRAVVPDNGAGQEDG
jgi:hypothetical protein